MYTYPSLLKVYPLQPTHYIPLSSPYLPPQTKNTDHACLTGYSRPPPLPLSETELTRLLSQGARGAQDWVVLALPSSWALFVLNMSPHWHFYKSAWNNITIVVSYKLHMGNHHYNGCGYTLCGCIGVVNEKRYEIHVHFNGYYLWS